MAQLNNQVPTGTSGHVVPYLDGANTWSASQTLAAAVALLWSTRSQMTSPADGQLLLRNAAGTNFTSILLGGTGAGFPAIKRVGSGIEFRSANDASYCSIKSLDLNASQSIMLGIDGGGFLGWDSRSYIYSPSDGILNLSNSNLDDFLRLQFGGTSSAYPSIKRNGTGIDIRLADDSGPSFVRSSSLVVVSPAGAAVASANSNSIYTNEGATTRADFTLPSAAAGLGPYTFICQDTDGVRVIAAAGDTVQIASTVSASAGRVDSVTAGSSITFVAINATQWIATSQVGTWTVT